MAFLPLILLSAASFILLICAIWMIVLGFQRHWLWGVALLIPQLVRVASIIAPADSPAIELSNQVLNLVGFVVYLCFLVAAWPVTKPPFFWSLAGAALSAAFALNLIYGPAPMSPQVATLLMWQGARPAAIREVNILRAKAGTVDQTSGQPSSGRRRAVPLWGSRGNPPPAGAPRPELVFRSVLPPPKASPGEREPAPPGIFYLLERVTTTTPRGVQAARPGERVSLLERLPNNQLRVTIDHADFVVHRSQLTDDLTVAREAERQDFVAHGGKL